MIQDEFVKHVQSCGAEFNRSKQPVVLFHHNDSDGISSAAILTAAFERAGISFRRYCLEKPYPQVVTQILNLHKNEKPRVVVADFGSGMLSGPDMPRRIKNYSYWIIIPLWVTHIRRWRLLILFSINCLGFQIVQRALSAFYLR
jgi:hypothetical protein